MKAGAKVLCQYNGTAEDAVVEVLSYLENDTRFNCGLGSSPNIDGQVEQDALIIDRYGRSGAIASAPCK
jgi:taspase, threonine aspartase, 1